MWSRFLTTCSTLSSEKIWIPKLTLLLGFCPLFKSLNKLKMMDNNLKETFSIINIEWKWRKTIFLTDRPFRYRNPFSFSFGFTRFYCICLQYFWPYGNNVIPRMNKARMLALIQHESWASLKALPSAKLGTLLDKETLRVAFASRSEDL